MSLFRLLEINLEPLRALLIGGIAFATPDTPGLPARDGMIFVLP